jgi:hypothetical protein
VGVSDSAPSFRKKDDFAARSIAGEMIIVPVRSQVGDLDWIYNLSEVGAFIWQRIDGRTTAGQIAEAVGSEYEVSPGEAERDTLQFIADLEEAGIVERAGGGG